MSFSLHSSTVNFGGGRRSSSSGSNSSSSCSVSVKSLMGLMSRKVSARPSSRNQLERVALDGDQIRQRRGPRRGSRTNSAPGWWTSEARITPRGQGWTRRRGRAPGQAGARESAAGRQRAEHGRRHARERGTREASTRESRRAGRSRVTEAQHGAERVKVSRAQREPGSTAAPSRAPPPEVRRRCYLSSTVAPAPSRAALAFSASSLDDLLEDGLGGAVHEVLGLLEAEAGERRGPP